MHSGIKSECSILNQKISFWTLRSRFLFFSPLELMQYLSKTLASSLLHLAGNLKYLLLPWNSYLPLKSKWHFLSFWIELTHLRTNQLTDLIDSSASTIHTDRLLCNFSFETYFYWKIEGVWFKGSIGVLNAIRWVSICNMISLSRYWTFWWQLRKFKTNIRIFRL